MKLSDDQCTVLVSKQQPREKKLTRYSGGLTEIMHAKQLAWHRVRAETLGIIIDFESKWKE